MLDVCLPLCPEGHVIDQSALTGPLRAAFEWVPWFFTAGAEYGAERVFLLPEKKGGALSRWIVARSPERRCR